MRRCFVSTLGELQIAGEHEGERQDHYLFKLAAFPVPAGAKVVLHGLRQAVNLDTTDAMWRFADGNMQLGMVPR
jgi:hypothetical protein